MSKAEIIISTSEYSVATRATYRLTNRSQTCTPYGKEERVPGITTDGMTSDEMFLSRPIVIFLFYQIDSRDEPNLITCILKISKCDRKNYF